MDPESVEPHEYTFDVKVEFTMGDVWLPFDEALSEWAPFPQFITEDSSPLQIAREYESRFWPSNEFGVFCSLSTAFDAVAYATVFTLETAPCMNVGDVQYRVTLHEI